MNDSQFSTARQYLTTKQDGDDCETYEKGKDYLVDETWGMLGRVADGRIAADEVVAVDYKFSTCRLDTIQVSADGTVSLRKGGEVILLTPHFMWPPSMGMKDCRGTDRRRACQALREIAEEKLVGLADAARVWQHLFKVGIPYTTLLKNGFNHTDDRGHQIFVDELMKFF